MPKCAPDAYAQQQEGQPVVLFVLDVMFTQQTPNNIRSNEKCDVGQCVGGLSKHMVESPLAVGRLGE